MTTLEWDEVFDCAVAAWCRSSTSQEMLRMCFQRRTQQNEVSVGWTANELMAFATGIARLVTSPTPPAEQAAPKAAPGDAIDEAMRERDDAEDFIDALLDEVLGRERPEWSNLYGRADALNDVQERMTALHKPAVDKAWGQFQSAMAAPQQEAQEPAVPPCISDAYERIDRFLRNNLGDEDYADFSHDLELLCTAQPTPQPAPDCHHRPPCDECAAPAAQGGKA